MFGIGFWETIFVLAAIIIFVKPEDIPGFIRRVGRLYGKLRKSYDTLKDNIENIEEGIKSEIKETDYNIGNIKKEILDVVESNNPARPVQKQYFKHKKRYRKRNKKYKDNRSEKENKSRNKKYGNERRNKEKQYKKKNHPWLTNGIQEKNDSRNNKGSENKKRKDKYGE